MPVISPTTLFVAGSMMETLSPAALVWIIRTLPEGGGELVVELVDMVCPRTHAARVCHSGSPCDIQCLPPSWLGSPPASSASGCSRKRLLAGSAGTTLRRITSKFLRDSSSVQAALPATRGCKRIGEQVEG